MDALILVKRLADRMKVVALILRKWLKITGVQHVIIFKTLCEVHFGFYWLMVKALAWLVNAIFEALPKGYHVSNFKYGGERCGGK